MRARSILAIVGMIAPSAHAQDWTVIPLGTSASLRAIEKSSHSQRYVVGDAGFVAQSDPTQLVWTPVSVGSTDDLLAVHQPSAGQAWISGAGGAVRRLVAASWESRDIASAEDFVVFSRSSGASFAGGTGGSIYRSTDGGDNWSLQSSGTTSAIRDGNGFSTSLAYAVGDGGTILKTVDGGANWVAKPSGTTANLYAYLEGAAGWLFAAGEGGILLRSTDAGETWLPIATGTTADLHDLDSSAQNANWMLAVGEGGTVLRSTDAGSTWCLLDSGTTADLFAADMVLNSKYTVAGAGGYLAVSETSGGGCYDPTGVPALEAAAGFSLSGPWPQPIAATGRFELSVDGRQHVQADLIDVGGRRVRSLLSAGLGDGERRTVVIDARRLAAGVYFLRVEGESRSETRRIVVVR
ncbi:MAG: YCF48-related protein [Candidatus Eiseniibacteriota bacterium]